MFSFEPENIFVGIVGQEMLKKNKNSRAAPLD